MDLASDPPSSDFPSHRRNWRPARIIVDATVAKTDTTAAVITRCGCPEVYEVRSTDGQSDSEILVSVLGLPSTIPGSELKALARTSLFLTDSPELLQQMAAGPAVERRCFNFLKILPYTGVCPYGCAYCWFKDPVLLPRINVRFFERLPQVLERLRAEHRTPTVFTFTHYKTDCLAIEHLTGFCRRAADVFESEPGFAIQLMTKSDQVDGLLAKPIPRKMIVTFSINPAWITTHVDLAAPPLEARLKAAQRLQSVGIPVMLRIDPILEIEDWAAAYDEMAGTIFAYLEPAQITLGTPRFQDLSDLLTVVQGISAPAARDFMSRQADHMKVSKPGRPRSDQSFRSHFKNMSVSYGDAKRTEMYRFVADALRRRSSRVPLGLCEEPATIWERVGLEWRGDKTQDCSCNFIPAAIATFFSPEDLARVAREAKAARERDANAADDGDISRLPVVY